MLGNAVFFFLNVVSLVLISFISFMHFYLPFNILAPGYNDEGKNIDQEIFRQVFMAKYTETAEN